MLAPPTMRTGFGAHTADRFIQNQMRAQLMGCVHTLMSHALTRATLYFIHTGTQLPDVAFDAETIRIGLIYEALEDEGVGRSLATLAESLSIPSDCEAESAVVAPSAGALESVDCNLREELAHNVEYALFMMLHDRLAEYTSSLSQVVFYDTDRLLAQLQGRASATVLEALEALDNQTASCSSVSESDDDMDAASLLPTDDEQCTCTMCRSWPSMDARFAAWVPEGRMAAILQGAIASISSSSEINT